MAENLDKLRAVGAQKIHEQTHISLKYIDAILYESFEGMQKVQLMGFISILEREYHVDLSDLRAQAQVYFQAQKELQSQEEEPDYKKKLLVSQTSKTMWLKDPRIVLALIGGVVAVIAAVWFSSYDKTQYETSSSTQEVALADTTSSKGIQEKEHTIQPTQPKEQKQPDTKIALTPSKEQNATTTVSSEQNETVVDSKEQNATQIEQKQEKVQPLENKQLVVETLKIIPRKKVWIGYIDRKTRKHRQKTTRRVVRLDPKKEYLIALGHGYVDIVVGKKKKHFKTASHLRFHYKDGVLTPISKKRFIALNQGKIW